MNWTEISSQTTTLLPDSIEHCLYNDLHVVACGTYELKNDEETNRIGELILFTIDPETKHLKQEKALQMSGILDMKWNLQNEKCALGIACADGKIHVLNFDSDLSPSSAFDTQSVCDGLCLSLDWSNDRILGSYSSGDLCVFTPDMPTCAWSGHAYEAWTAIFDRFNEHIIYSGGDDMKLNVWDTRSLPRPASVCSVHSAGVTCIVNSPYESTIVVGSYDETISLWDKRSWKSPVSLTSLGKSVWRMKWNGINAAICGMYEGCGTLQMVNEGKMEITSSFMAPGEGVLAYGIDWIDPYDILVTASFYNRQIQTWTLLP